jgi:hypothetical protein
VPKVVQLEIGTVDVVTSSSVLRPKSKAVSLCPRSLTFVVHCGAANLDWKSDFEFCLSNFCAARLFHGFGATTEASNNHKRCYKNFLHNIPIKIEQK